MKFLVKAMLMVLVIGYKTQLSSMAIMQGATGLFTVGGGSFARFAELRKWKVVVSNVPEFMNKSVHSASMNITEYDYNDWTNKEGKQEWTKTEDITNFVKKEAGQK